MCRRPGGSARSKELTTTADAAATALAGAPERRVDPEPSDETTGPGPRSVKGSAADRRRAVAWLIEAWRLVARDLAIAPLVGPAGVHDATLLEDLGSVGSRLAPGAISAFLERLVRAGQALEVNASPELVVDVLALAWPRARPAA